MKKRTRLQRIGVFRRKLWMQWWDGPEREDYIALLRLAEAAVRWKKNATLRNEAILWSSVDRLLEKVDE